MSSRDPGPGESTKLAEARESVVQTLASLGLEDTMLGTSSERLARPSVAPPDRPTLPRVPFRPPRRPGSDADGDLVARETLGRGGMGVVYLARQRSLGRDVAVKTTSSHDAGVVSGLVREARIMGVLEHPSVVPVHALGVDDEGAPVLVMKRVEGVSWRTLIHEDEHPAWKDLVAGHGDRLRAHVEILVQVCRALAFAHDRGFVHRDVKPDNVMIGRFGEVYLLDWGVALHLHDRDREPRAIVGTPGYLAPEMAYGDPLRIGTHTDVYLLGATLYEVLARRPPHGADNALLAIAHALVAEPPAPPEGAPPELVALAQRAMASDPAERLESAESFREGLARFLASHEAELVADAGRAALARAELAIEGAGISAPAVLHALIEARFAFASALRLRPGDAPLYALRERCTVHLVERELACRSPTGARSFLGELDAPGDGLSARVAALEDEIRAEREAALALQRAQREGDASLSVGALSAVFASLLAFVLPLLVLRGSVPAHRISEPISTTTSWLGALAIAAAAMFVLRRGLLATEATRRLAAFFTTMLVAVAVLAVVSLALRHTFLETNVHAFVCCAAVSTAGAVTVLPRMWPAGLVYLAGAVAMLAVPAWTLWIELTVVPTCLAIHLHALRYHALRSRAPARPA